MTRHGNQPRPGALRVQEAIAIEDKALEDLQSVARVVSRLNYITCTSYSIWSGLNGEKPMDDIG